ncbi:hypothetical protein [Thalassospira sp. TSL5-1]|uniref:hypothetical protein n=1 Tax=Thalassospira sp. TSL5-1 TaxID=1544451 RepID=UPI000939C397|nr:hypothetical protein [Thalassospira sp. TSL5-1]
MKRLIKVVAIAALVGSFVAGNVSSAWAQAAGGASGAGSSSTGTGGAAAGAGAAGGAAVGGITAGAVAGGIAAAAAAGVAIAVASYDNVASLTAAEKKAIDDAKADPASLAQVVQKILQDHRKTQAGLSPNIAGLVTSYAIKRNPNAAATITSTAVAVAGGGTVEVKEENGLVVVTIVASAVASVPDKAGEIMIAAATVRPEFVEQITQAAVTAAPDRAADITTAAVRFDPSRAAVVAKAAATAAPQQAKAITTAAVAAAPSQATTITTQVSAVQGVNSQDVQAAANTTTEDSVDTTNDGFDDVEPAPQSAAQENPASPDTPET